LKANFKKILKREHVDVFLVFSAVMVFAALFATSALAQPEGALEQPNQPPALSSFGPDKSSPQEAGAVITWTAQASDPENDPILYRFILNSQPVTDWTLQSQWIWTTSSANVGTSQVEVQVKDGNHNPEGDDSRSEGFTIAMPNQPPAITNFGADKPSPQEAGAVITWMAQASDPENDPILYRFILSGQPVTDWTPRASGSGRPAVPMWEPVRLRCRRRTAITIRKETTQGLQNLP